MTFISFATQINELINQLLNSHKLHAKWLNTLSFLENCGARKIAACEHPTLVKKEMLKHAAEEFRHAHHLKKQIEKIWDEPIETYSLSFILGGTATLNYLNLLNLKASRYLKKRGFSNSSIKEAAYLLVTYAIELRAEELYPIYDAALRKVNSRVTVKSILLEEKEHLNEMRDGIKNLFHDFQHAEVISSIESSLCKIWLDEVAIAIS